MIDCKNRTVDELLDFITKNRILSLKVIHLLNESGNNIIQKILKLIKEHSSIDAVAIRLKDNNDFPYYTYEGFEPHFIEKENYLCSATEKDINGKPLLECMCGLVINGNYDPALPFFSRNGSFWTNSTTELLKIPSDLKIKTRNMCNIEGYESVALIPLYYDNHIEGLLQLNDKRKNLFCKHTIEYYEGLVEAIGAVLQRKEYEEKLKDYEKKLEDSVIKYKTLFEQTSDSIVLIDVDTMRISECNSNAHNSLGYTKDEFINLKLSQIDAIENNGDVELRISKIKEEGKAEFVTKHVTKDNKIKLISIKSSKININDKEYLLSTWDDITDVNHKLNNLENMLLNRVI
jgi:PAS domain S-box-containing protein